MSDSATAADPCTRCLEDLRKQYDAITKAMRGEHVTSAGHKGRSIAYSPAQVKEMIAFYNQLWDQCGAGSGLPRLKPLDQPTMRRGGPFRPVFGGRRAV